MSSHEREPLTPEERELAGRLARLGAPAEPPPALDARILAAAHAAAVGRGRSPHARRRRWPVALGIAATLALAVGVAWRLRPTQDAVQVYSETPVAAVGEQGSGPSAAEELPMASEPQPAQFDARQAAASAADAETAGEDAAQTEAAQASAAQAPDADAAANAAPDAFAQADRDRAVERRATQEQPAHDRAAQSKVAQDAASQERTERERALDQPAPAPASAAPAPPAEPAQVVFDLPAPAPPPPPPAPADEGAQADAPARTQRGEAERAAPVTQSADASEALEPTGAGIERDNAGFSDQALDDQPPATADSPEVQRAWLQRIRELLAEGDTEGARASLAEFKRRNPRYALPDDLREFAP